MNWSKPVVVARLNQGDIIQLSGKAFKIISLPEAYDRNSIAAYKTTIVEDAAGARSEVKLYANQRYSRREG